MGHSIRIQEKANAIFEVVVSDGGGDATTHEVHVDERYVKKLGWGMQDIGTLLRESFEFLLEREPKEAILSSFELSDIAHYFPEYETQFRTP